MVMPLTNQLGKTLIVTTAMGLPYGLVVGTGIGVLLLPQRVPVVFPYPDSSLLTGFTLFGLIMSSTYGKLIIDRLPL